MKKIGILAMVLIFALGALGVGYANWLDYLYIEGTVSTGNIDPVFFNAYGSDLCEDDGFDPSGCGSWNTGVFPPTWSGGDKGKDVGCTCVSPSGKTLYITITNAYPCYYSNVIFGIVNNGSVPVYVDGIRIVEISKGAVGGPYAKWAVDWPIKACDTWYIDVETQTRKKKLDEDVHDFSLHLSKLAVDQQLDAAGGGSVPADILYGDLCIHVEQDANQLKDYDFKVEIVFRNFDD